MTAGKYGPKAKSWTADAYADADAYLDHRAELIRLLGPALEPGDTVLDLACGDGGLAERLTELRYFGVDASPEMVEEGKRKGRNVVLGDLNDYRPPQPVSVTTCFRAIYYAPDRPAFFRQVAAYTEKKLVFDLNPRQFRLDAIRADLQDAGFDLLEIRPFFSPQRLALPRPASGLLRALEVSGPLARLLLAIRFSYLCAAFRGSRNA